MTSASSAVTRFYTAAFVSCGLLPAPITHHKRLRFSLDLSGRAMARSGLRMMPTFPLPSLKFRTAGFPQYGFKAGFSDRAFPVGAPSRRSVCHRPSCSPLPSSDPRSVPGDVVRWNTSVRAASAALPQGPSLRPGFFCPGPSTLNRPHPSHSQAHPDFTA
jgi:hypothetical protein